MSSDPEDTENPSDSTTDETSDITTAPLQITEITEDGDDTDSNDPTCIDCDEEFPADELNADGRCTDCAIEAAEADPGTDEPLARPALPPSEQETPDTRPLLGREVF